jgi:hypothetical protein
VKSYSQTEPPKLLTDAEFDALLDARKERERHVRKWDRWDVSGSTVLNTASDGKAESMIEQRFPHVAGRLTVFWRSHSCGEYIRSILLMDREGRQGFPPEVVDDLLMLHQLNERVIRIGSLDLSPTRKPAK